MENCHIRMLIRMLSGAFAALMLLVALPIMGSASVVSDAVVTERSAASLISEIDYVVPGRTSTLAFRLKLQPGWHTYWINPGESGMPASLNWTLPPEVTVGPILWPAPELIPYGPLVNYGFKDEVWLLSEITVPADFQATTLNLSVNADWLVCEELCIPEEGRLDLALPVALNASLPEAIEKEFRTARAALPANAAGRGFSANQTSTGVSLSCPVANHND